MARDATYLQGFREASKLAVAYVQAEAQRMNDPKARQVLNALQFGLGVELKRAFKDKSTGVDGPEGTAAR